MSYSNEDVRTLHLNRQTCYERTQEEIAYYKIKSIYIRERDLAAITKIKTRDDYAFTKPDQEIRYDQA